MTPLIAPAVLPLERSPLLSSRLPPKSLFVKYATSPPVIKPNIPPAVAPPIGPKIKPATKPPVKPTVKEAANAT